MSLAWTIEYDRDAVKALKKLDRPVAAKILSYLDDVAATGNPRAQGKGLTGNLAGLWHYRIGNCRVICDLRDDELIIVAVGLGHRSDI